MARGSAKAPRKSSRAGKTLAKSARAEAPSEASFDKAVIALVYDFDGTLSPRPMQEYAFLPKIGVDPRTFWEESNRIAAEEGADPLITYMHLLYKKAKDAGVRVDREDLVAQGREVELFAGVEAWFEAMNTYVAQAGADSDITVRHYLISSGLTEIIEGTPIYPAFHNVFASEYWFDAYDLPYPKRVITDTGKTQYLFRINKGVEDLGQSINEHMPEARRPVPFANIIYFGDGDTDVPSMAVTRKNGGHAIAVHGPGQQDAKCRGLFEAGRCDFYAPADYRVGSELHAQTCLLIDRIIADIRVQAEIWRLKQSGAMAQ
ncbi:MAG: HAD family hydrolase [Pseudomonadota bacterium]